MPKLYKNQVFLMDLLEARSLKQRLFGLIPYRDWPEQRAFWIPSCSSVHTFFMSFSLDVFFTNRRFQILRIFENVGAKRLLFGGLKSRHVFELKAGQISNFNLKQGERLHVEP